MCARRTTRPFSTSYASHKKGGEPCLDCELGVLTHKDKLAWIDGPFPSATHDRAVFRSEPKAAIEKKQQERSNEEIRALADDGHFAEDLVDTLSFRNEFDPPEIAQFKDRALSRHEKFNGLTKCFGILAEPFHHDRGHNPDRQHPRHKAVVEAICVTVQCGLDLGTLSLFDACPQRPLFLPFRVRQLLTLLRMRIVSGEL